MKTAEKMAEDEADRIERQAILCVSLLAMNDGEYFAAKKAYKAGYQAAQNQFCEAVKILEKHKVAAENAVTNIKNAGDWVTIEREKANENT